MASAIIIFVLLLFLIGHAILIERYRSWFLKVIPFHPSPNHVPATKFTVVIPARNEEHQVGKCLQSVLDQKYPLHLFEVIVADDYSTDNTAAVVRKMQQQYSNLHLMQLEKLLGSGKVNSYKKKAIELAIKQSTGDWIVTTDADCIVPGEWLTNFSNFIHQKNAVFVAAPVKFINSGSFVSVFQCLDFISLQGITAASVNAGVHTMCNGANLAYKKEVFYEVEGFKGIDTIASGDDMLLMYKIYKHYKNQVHYLFSQKATVQTLPMETWGAFINQRIRWASKADKFEDKRILYVLIFVYAFNLLFLLLPVTVVWINNIGWYWLCLLAAKTIIDYRFMVPVAKFFKEEKLLWWFALMQPFHIGYTIVAGWFGKFGKYSWKGRMVN